MVYHRSYADSVLEKQISKFNNQGLAFCGFSAPSPVAEPTAHTLPHS